MGIDTFVILFSFAILSLQLFLCLKVKSKIIRLLPVILLIAMTIIFFVMSSMASGWEAFGYFLLAYCMIIMLFACGVAWIIWAIRKFMKKK